MPYYMLNCSLKYVIMEAPAISGSQTYAELCIAAKNEERRQSELAKRQHYARTNIQSGGNNNPGTQAEALPRDQATTTRMSSSTTEEVLYLQ